MNFESLKEQLRDQWAELWGKIQENSTFQTAKERFEALSLNTQRLIIVGTAVLAVLFILSFPYAYVSTSDESMLSFEENRSLIRDLLQASRTMREPSPLPAAMGVEGLRNSLQSIITESRLVPEQIVGIEPAKAKPAGSLAPGVVQQDGLVVTLKTLNLKQIVDLGHRFQALNSGVKVMSIDVVRSAGQTHYYDVVYKVVTFSLPNLMENLEADQPRGGKGGAFGNRGGRPPPKRAGRGSSPPPEEGAPEDDGEDE